MDNLSILNDLNKAKLSFTPFPHVIIKDALPKKLADALTKDFPSNLFDFSENNKRLDISAHNVMNNGKISHLWKEFIEYHCSAAFYLEVLRVFEPCFKISEYNYFSEFSTGIRGINPHRDKQILLDAQISINTPVTKPSSVRNAHIDNTNKLFSGLYYIRRDNDDSEGGDLEILSWKESYANKDKLKYYREGVSPKHFTKVKKISYSNNVAIIFLNSINSMHSVSPRHLTPHPRQFVNLVGELKEDLFIKHTIFKNHVLTLKEKLRQLIRR